jgi:hypothetical protein
VGETNSDIDFFINNFRITGSSLGLANVTANDFTYFPNPVKDVLNLSFSNAISQVEVFNLLGQKIVSAPFNGRQALDMSQLARGTYIVKVHSGQSITNIKVLKE